MGKWTWIVFLPWGLGAPCWGQAIHLLAEEGTWSAGIDRGGTRMSLQPTGEAKIAVHIATDGGDEDYPKLSRSWTEPQDWTRYMWLRTRLRVTCDDPNLRERPLQFVFYDEKTRRADLPDHPMTQQGIAHSVPVGEWVEYRDGLLPIHRSAILGLAIYLYENPPATPHTCHWEFAELQLEGVGEQAEIFDMEVYRPDQLRGAQGPPAAQVETEDGLGLVLGREGQVNALTLDGQPVGEAEGQLTGLLVRDVAAGGPPQQVGGTLQKVGPEVWQQAHLEEEGLAVQATYRSRGPVLEVSGTVADLRGQDRAVTLYLALPLRQAPWQWWDSVSVGRTQADGWEELANLETGLEYGLNGAHSRYPLGAISHPRLGGLSLAIRMDEPVVHRIAYHPRLHLFYLALDFGLVPAAREAGRPLSEAPFRILLYRHDPTWGFRSALQRYYDLFPEFFTKRVPREGGWYCWGDVSTTEGALEAGFGVHWGPQGYEAVKWDNQHGVLAFLYIEPEFYQQTMGDFDRAPTREEGWERLFKLAAGDPGETEKFAQLAYASSYVPGGWRREHSLAEAIQTVARAAERSATFGVDGRPTTSIGQYPWMGESRWGVMYHCNLDPDIPQGKGWFAWEIYLQPELQAAEEAGAHYDGVGLDSFGGYGHFARADYRRENFPYAEEPLCFSAMGHRPVRVAAFASVEWLRKLAREMHGRGRYLMTNCSWHVTPGWLTFAAPSLDVFGAEAAAFADPDFIRAIARHKTCTDLPYTPRPQAEVAQHLLHGIFPGHGNNLEWMRQQADLLRALAAAGWEPITQARVEPSAVRVERFGSGPTVYLVLHNPTPEPVQCRLQVEAAALGLQEFQAVLAASGEALEARQDGLIVPLEPRGTSVVTLRAKRPT